MAKIEYKVGDLVKIIKNRTNHRFKIGERVRVRSEKNGFIDTCESLNKHNWWWVDNSEVTPVKEKTNNKQSSIKTETMNITKTDMKNAVETVANQLASKLGRITTLELKNELMNVFPAIVWNQYTTGVVSGVSDLFHELVREGKFYSIADNGTYQTYLPQGVRKGTANALGTAIKKANPKKTKVVALGGTLPASTTVSVTTTKKAAKKAKKPTYTVTQLRDMMKNNKGHFFTATFISQKGERTINGQYVSNQVIKPGQEHYVIVREAVKMKKTPTDDIRQINLNTLKSLKIAGKTIVI
jgi:hypothetical protein